jgi:kinesin family protein C1
VEVTNLTSVDVSTPSAVRRVLAASRGARAVAATHCNQHSSRSHSVFRLTLAGRNVHDGQVSYLSPLILLLQLA